MPSLHRFNLDRTQTMLYLEENLRDTNTLSTAVIDLVPFHQGSFYTLLHKDIKSEQAYQFEYGGVGGSVKDKISYLVLEEIDKNTHLNCLFDDTGATYIEPYDDPLFLKAGIHCNGEVYYLIKKQQVSKELLDTCFYASEATWHSLCVLSNFQLDYLHNRLVNSSLLRDFVIHSHMILIGAYDGEGYVFWEKISK